MNPFIRQFENELSKDFCRHCIEKFECDSRSRQGEIGRGLDTSVKKSLDLVFSSFEDWKYEDSIFYESLNKTLDLYLDIMNNTLPTDKDNTVNMFSFDENTTEVRSDSGYQIQKTCPGDFYDWHSDTFFATNPEKENSCMARFLTFIWYLNDIHEDGYTEFYDGTRIQPEEGKLIIFPATWDFIHRGVSPKTEEKYICTGWIHSTITLN